MENVIEKLAVEDAAKLMGLDVTTVKKGLQQGTFPWGYAIKTTETSYRYWINKQKFEEVERI